MKKVVEKVEEIIRKIIVENGYESFVISHDGYYLVINENESHFFERLDDIVKSFSGIIDKELTFIEKPLLPFVVDYIEGLRQALKENEAIQVCKEGIKWYKEKEVNDFDNLVELFDLIESKNDVLDLPKP